MQIKKKKKIETKRQLDARIREVLYAGFTRNVKLAVEGISHDVPEVLIFKQ